MSDFRSWAAELACEPWAMEPQRLEAMLSRLSDSKEAPLGGFMSQPPEGARKTRMEIKDGVATVPITGVLVKSVPRIFTYYGIDATAYRDIQDDVAAALADPAVRAIRLKVESPGGQVAGVKETGDLIHRASGKVDVFAEISEIGASAAYWLAAQAPRIVAAPNALVGSIGVYSAYMDLSRLAENVGIKVHLIASGPHKGMGVPGTRITEPQLAAMQDVIDGMAAGFKADVARGRKMAAKDVEALATGRVWTSEQGLANGLVDAILEANSKRQAGPAGGRSAADFLAEAKEEPMDPKELAAHQAKAAEEAKAAERTRAKEIRAAFPKDPEFALAQIDAGSTLEQAQAAYAAVVSKRNEALSKENEELRAKAAAPAAPAKAEKPAGAPALEDAGEAAGGGAGASADFVGQAEKLATEKRWTLQQAMSHLARKEPELYERYCQACVDGAKAPVRGKGGSKFSRVAK